MLDILLFWIAVVLGYLRVTGHTSLFFRAIAHVVVGGLWGAGLAASKENDSKPFYLALATTLTILEVICFAYGKLHGQ